MKFNNKFLIDIALFLINSNYINILRSNIIKNIKNIKIVLLI